MDRLVQSTKALRTARLRSADRARGVVLSCSRDSSRSRRTHVIRSLGIPGRFTDPERAKVALGFIRARFRIERTLADSPTRRVEPWAHLRDVFCLLPDWPARDARPRAPTQGQVRRTQRRSRSTRGEPLPPPHARLISLTTNQLEERGSLSRYEGPHRRGAAPAVAGRPRFESSCCRTASGPACARQQAPDRPPG